MAADPQLVPNWIAAISTALTAVGGGIAAWIGWVRSRNSRLPIVEATTGWSTEFGRFVQVHFTIRNRLRETLVWDSVEVFSPSDMRMGVPISESYHGLVRVDRGTSNEQMLGYRLNPIGTERHPHGVHPGDTLYQTIYLSPPESFSSGKIKLALYFSSLGDTLKCARVTVSRSVRLPSGG